MLNKVLDEQKKICLCCLILYIIFFIKNKFKYIDNKEVQYEKIVNLFENYIIELKLEDIYKNNKTILDEKNLEYVNNIITNYFEKSNNFVFKSFRGLFNYDEILPNLKNKYQHDLDFVKIDDNLFCYNLNINNNFIFVDDDSFDILETSIFGFLLYFGILNSITDENFSLKQYLSINDKNDFNSKLEKLLRLDDEDKLNNKLCFLISLKL